jgi:hypothetical protein
MLAQAYNPISEAQVNPGLMDVSEEQTSILRQVHEGNSGLHLPETIILPSTNQYSSGVQIVIRSRGSVNVDPFEKFETFQSDPISALKFCKEYQSGKFFGQQDPQKQSRILLQDVFDECRHANWDGEGADPVEESTFIHAIKFLDLLPIDTPSPEIDASPHGLITFEWDLSSRRTLVAGIDSNGYIYYSALLDDEDERGKVRMDQKACYDIASLAQRIFLS